MLLGKYTSGDRMMDDLIDAIIALIVMGIFIILGSPFYNTILKSFL